MKAKNKKNSPKDHLFDGPNNRSVQPQTHDDFAPWFHNLHLPSGGQTAPAHPLGDYPAITWAQIRPELADDLRGWRVLNIGCNAGYFCFQLARLGARVLGCDRDPHCVRQAQWAAEQFQLTEQVQFRQMHVYEIARAAQRYDMVLFMGAFYELRYPALALDIMAERADKQLIFQPFSSINPFNRKQFSPLDASILEGLGFEVTYPDEQDVYFCRRKKLSARSSQAHLSPNPAEIAAAIGPRYRRIERARNRLTN